MLRVASNLVERVENADATDLSELLQFALRLEHATIPPYLTAAYSLKVGVNNPIRQAITTIAVEEMLHMAIVANVINAVGGQPQFASADFLPRYPGPLPMVIGNGLEVGLKKFSIELARDVFLVIEEPEHPLDFPVALNDALAIEPPQFRTIGAFYRAIIGRIAADDGSIFTGDQSRQVSVGSLFSEDDLFPITGSDSAIRALDRIVTEGEGTQSQPTDVENELAHYYRFHEIVQGRRLVRVTGTPDWAYAGAAIQFDPNGVWDLADNPKAGDHPDGSDQRVKVDAFNFGYCNMLRQLQHAFDGEPERIEEAERSMQRLRRLASDLVEETDPVSGKQLGPSFEYMPP